MGSEQKPVYSFGPFQADTAKRLLLKDGEPVQVTNKVFDTLLLLIEHRGHVVEKDLLLSRLWPDTIVEEKNLAVNISALRKALGENPQDHRYIVTTSGRGYSFVAGVTELGGDRELVVHDQVTTSVTIEQEERESTAWWPWAAAILGVLGLIAVGFVWQQRRSADAEITTIAVLPFKSIAGDSAEAQLQMGIADALIARLGRLPQLVVRPLASVRRYSRPDQNPLDAGKTLKVDSVLDGSLQQVAGRIRVTAQLLDVRSGKMQWTEQFDADANDPFAIQDSISSRMSNGLALRLSANEKNLLARHDTENKEAYVAYVQGRYQAGLNTRMSLLQSLDDFRRATTLDPNYAAGYAGLADALTWYGSDYGAPNEFIPQAEIAARRALELDPTVPGAGATLATILYRYRYNWSGAEAEFRRALQVNPNDAFTHHKYGWYLSLKGRFEEAKDQMRQAFQLAPTSLLIQADLGLPYYCSRRYDDTISMLQALIDANPRFSTAYFELSLNFLAQHRWQDAIDAVHKGALSDDSAEVSSALGIAYAKMGKRKEAEECLAKMRALTSSRYVAPASMGLIHLALGEREAALDLLEKGYEDHSWWMQFLKVDPRFDELRGEPRFQKLLTRLGLA
jgi:DNA-binding winged helix-turn-helix (wHTH) protein/TolB-like protein/Flp pilus assembly protein TadD